MFQTLCFTASSLVLEFYYGQESFHRTRKIKLIPGWLNPDEHLLTLGLWELVNGCNILPFEFTQSLFNYIRILFVPGFVQTRSEGLGQR